MFADDSKLWAKIKKMEDKESLQKDLDKMNGLKTGYSPSAQRSAN